MDINFLREAVTVASFLSFIGIVAWAWSSRRRETFDQLARSILDDGPGQNREG